MIINCNEIINNKQQLYTMYTMYTRQTNISVNKHQQQTKHQQIPPHRKHTRRTHRQFMTHHLTGTTSPYILDQIHFNHWPKPNIVGEVFEEISYENWQFWHVAWSKLCQYNLWSTNMLFSVHFNSLKTSLSSWARQSINSTCI